jgi:hypothetical protein
MRSICTVGAAILILAGTSWAGDSLVLVGTVTNTTNPKSPVTAELVLSIDEQKNCVLRVGPPLYGSGACAITSFDEKAHTISFESYGPLITIKASGVVNVALMGSYSVLYPSLPEVPQEGTFELRVVDGREPLSLADVLVADTTRIGDEEYLLWRERDLVSFHHKDGKYAGMRIFLGKENRPSLIIQDSATGSIYTDAVSGQVLLEWTSDGKNGYFKRTNEGVSVYLDRFLQPTGWSSLMVNGQELFIYEDKDGAELFDANLKSLGIRAHTTTTGKLYWTYIQDGVTQYFDASFKPLNWYSFTRDGQTIFAYGSGKRFKFYDSNLREIKATKKPGFWARFAQGMALGLAAYGQALQAQAAAQQQGSTYQNTYSAYSLPSYNSTTIDTTPTFGWTTTTDTLGNSYTTMTQRIGNFTYSHTRGSGGYTSSATTQSIGQFDYTNGMSNAGAFYGVRQHIGDFSYLNLSTPTTTWTGTSQRIGNFTFHNFTSSTGQTLSGTSQRIGDFIFTTIH